MTNKLKTAQEAIAGLQDGMTIMVSGFLGTGSPEILMDAILEKGVKHLTVIGNDGGLPRGWYNEDDTPRGIGKLLDAGIVDHIIASHVGVNPLIGKGIVAGTLECTLVPQGSLAEKVRAGNFGLGGVLTPTGVGTLAAEGKMQIEIDGKMHLLEKALKADYSFCRASVCDEFGNFLCNKATKNFNYLMAGAADHNIIATERLVKEGELDPDVFQHSGVLVDTIVEGEKQWQI
ncbi:MAG TPA: 3-oxoacid CoA-transferase subunit A [Anaerovoracaceae bacterium]|nr:3-oxoacid CoA-transferase subunit A [Anaerovoracaceae bacterium]